jgi:hypothetical protein
VSDALLRTDPAREGQPLPVLFVNFLLEFYKRDLVVRLGERWQDQERLTRLGSDRERFGM